MPFIQIHSLGRDGVDYGEAQIYYQAYGTDQADRAPVVLIHGSTHTGQDDWAQIAPLLGRFYRVIVPDCRGHGQSSSTPAKLSYSFKELAADTAALVRALGYTRAHIVGHSNGGNVALVTLLEHPEVVQTCVMQAANAFVSPDLVEKEPAIFEPERVARENPAWMQFMIAAHGPTHGVDYWRDLLRLTVQEIISEPNYTAAELSAVQRPSLVIQGEKDQVNAPAGHAQFIATHIPEAELWLPAGVGHNVQLEQPLQWLERTLDFFSRRGDDANEAIYRLARTVDDRSDLIQVRAEMTAGVARLHGRTIHAAQSARVVETVRAATNLEVDSGDVSILLTEDTPWALINRPVTDLRRAPRSLAERVSQALAGEVVRILEAGEDWSYIRMEKDSYLGWVHSAALYVCSAAEAQNYRQQCNALVMAELASAFPENTHPARSAGSSPLAKLPFGIAVIAEATEDGYSKLRLPDGRRLWVAEADLLALEQRPRLNAAGKVQVLSLIRRFAGVPYLWGGRSPFGYDCSGLAQTYYGLMGLSLERDADQQFTSTLLEEVPLETDKGIDLQPGDLLYFGEAVKRLLGQATPAGGNAHRPITHVGISLGGAEIIHANGSAWGVSYNSLDPEKPGYRSWLRENLAGVRRPKHAGEA